jgi:DNA-binding NtrC family response regulator
MGFSTMDSVSDNSQAQFSKPSEGLSAATALLVDDDPALLEALSRALALRLPHIRVETCSSAGAAFQRIATRDYDLILSDLRMPGVEGLALLGMIRKLRPTTPFILMTADSASLPATTAKAQGAFRVLSKPLDRDVLIATVNEALQGPRPQWPTDDWRSTPPCPAA